MAWRSSRGFCTRVLRRAFALGSHLDQVQAPVAGALHRSSGIASRKACVLSRFTFFWRANSSAAPATSAAATAPGASHIRSLQEVELLQNSVSSADTEGQADILETHNGQLLYAGFTSGELLATLINLNLVASEPLVDLSIKLLKSPLAEVFPLRNLFHFVVKRTAYLHFCAGEDVVEASAKLKRMWELGLRGILDYSLEDAEDNQACQRNLTGFLQTVSQIRGLPPGSVSSACVKLTAIAPIPLLERVSDLLRWQHVDKNFQLPWKGPGLPLLAPNSPTFHVQKAPEPLTAQEEQDLSAAEKRLWRLCEACKEVGLPLLVDAEYTSVQPAIDHLIFGAALEFNTSGPPLVYGTIQAYLKDALPRLSLASTAASERGVSLGVKLVRGAYLTRENSLAASLNAESPIHSTIEETHRCYDACAAFLLEQASAGETHVVLATHNIDSGKAAARKAEALGLARGDRRLQFAQLKGMADGLSLALAAAGFQVSKYLPFGPVAQVLPYLIRRAEENRGVLGNTRGEREQMREELKRRFYAALPLK